MYFYRPSLCECVPKLTKNTYDMSCGTLTLEVACVPRSIAKRWQSHLCVTRDSCIASGHSAFGGVVIQLVGQPVGNN